MAGFALTWRTYIAIKANKVHCTDRGIFSLFGPMCGLDVLVVLSSPSLPISLHPSPSPSISPSLPISLHLPLARWCARCPSR